MDYAVIKVSGKQYKVKNGDILTIARVASEKGKSFAAEGVLLTADGQKVTVGTPVVAGARVTLEVLEHLRGPKIRVAKFKAKARYRKVTGFKAEETKVKVNFGE